MEIANQLKLLFTNWNNETKRTRKWVPAVRRFILDLLFQLFTRCLCFKSGFSPALKTTIFGEISKEYSNNVRNVFFPCAHYNSQWFFWSLFLPKTFVLIFFSQKVTHECSINIAWHFNIKSLKFDSVNSIDKIWSFLKFLFLTRMVYTKMIIKFELLQLNHIRHLPKKSTTLLFC